MDKNSGSLFFAVAILSAFMLTCVMTGKAQAQSVSIATWQNNAKGAYSMIMDDFPGSWTPGIEQIADTMLANRGLAVSIATIVTHCTSAKWQVARDMVSRGHRIECHSWNHLQSWGPTEFAKEVDSALAAIDRNVPNQKCLFYAFPYDSYDDVKVNYLRTKGILGCRSGGWGANPNPYNLSDPFRPKYQVFGTAEQLCFKRCQSGRLGPTRNPWGSGRLMEPCPYRYFQGPS